MPSFNDLRRGAVGAAMTFVLAFADGCPATTRLDFDEMEENAVLDTEWAGLGIHFVQGPLFDGFPAANSLPRAMTSPKGPAPAGKVLLIPFSFSQPSEALLWCRLDNPATRVQVTVGNFDGGTVPVRLVVTDGNGNVRSDEKLVPGGGEVATVLEVTAPTPGITAFAVYAPRGVILMDNLIIDDVR